MTQALLPLTMGLMAAALTACGGSTSSQDTTTDSGTAGDAPATTAEGGGTDAGQPEASANLVTVDLSVCGPALSYYAPGTIGSQSFQLVIDTGSTTLGVASSTCTECGVSPEYTPGSSAVDEHQTATSDYGSGSWSGTVYEDTVAMGTASTSVKLAAITTEKEFFQQFQCGKVQGIVGFGPPGAELPGTNAFFDDLVASAGIPNVFATQLCDTSGKLWLGGFDPSATTAAPQYVPLSTVYGVYYGANLTSVTVNGTTIPIATAQNPDSAVDTGTSGFLVSTTAYNALTAAIQSNAAFTSVFGSSFFSSQSGGVACAASSASKASLDAQLPALTLNFGSVAVQAAPTESYLFPYENEAWCSALVTDPQVSAEIPLASIIGAPILRSSVVIFDRANKQLGFAPHTACP